jgi:hypothetical protein
LAACDAAFTGFLEAFVFFVPLTSSSAVSCLAQLEAHQAIRLERQQVIQLEGESGLKTASPFLVV